MSKILSLHQGKAKHQFRLQVIDFVKSKHFLILVPTGKIF